MTEVSAVRLMCCDCRRAITGPNELVLPGEHYPGDLEHKKVI